MESGMTIADISSQLPDGLSLTKINDKLTLAGFGMELAADFSHMHSRLKPANLSKELLVKATKLKHVKDTPRAIDATAGFGEDALLLACAGFHVTMYEYNPIIAALLRDAHNRALHDPALAPFAQNMELVEGNSIEALQNLGYSPDVIFLDPMFPERKKSAAVKKKFQLLHYLELPCSNEEALLNAALHTHPKKIVIKRPLKSPYLAHIKPDYSLRGKSIRYDCISSAGAFAAATQPPYDAAYDTANCKASV